MTLARLRTAALALVVAGALPGLSACGAAPSAPCPVPATHQLEAALEGEWSVWNAEGVREGAMRFHRREVVATADAIRYFGTWTSRPSGGLQPRIELVLDSASVDGQPQVYARPTRVELQLAFDTADTLVAIQSDGVWTRWERAPEPPAEPAPADPAEP